MKIGLNFKYLCAFIILFITIVLIAAFMPGGFIRHHFGDILIIIFIYCFVKSFVRNKMRWLGFAIFIFAVLVEIGQYFNMVEHLGLYDITIARIAIGTTFDLWDIVMYFIGCILLYVFEIISAKLNNKTHKKEQQMQERKSNKLLVAIFIISIIIQSLGFLIFESLLTRNYIAEDVYVATLIYSVIGSLFIIIPIFHLYIKEKAVQCTTRDIVKSVWKVYLFSLLIGIIILIGHEATRAVIYGDRRTVLYGLLLIVYSTITLYCIIASGILLLLTMLCKKREMGTKMKWTIVVGILVVLGTGGVIGFYQIQPQLVTGSKSELQKIVISSYLSLYCDTPESVTTIDDKQTMYDIFNKLRRARPIMRDGKLPFSMAAPRYRIVLNYIDTEDVVRVHSNETGRWVRGDMWSISRTTEVESLLETILQGID